MGALAVVAFAALVSHCSAKPHPVAFANWMSDDLDILWFDPAHPDREGAVLARVAPRMEREIKSYMGHEFGWRRSEDPVGEVVGRYTVHEGTRRVDMGMPKNTANSHADATRPGRDTPAPAPKLTLFFSDETGRGVFSELMDATGVRDASERSSQKTVQFYLGCAGSGAPNHFHSAAGNLLVYGRKAWYLQPPGAAAYSIIPAREYLRRYAEEADVLGLRCVQEAGDLLYVPSNWGHTTLNLRASVGFAQECNADACS